MELLPEPPGTGAWPTTPLDERVQQELRGLNQRFLSLLITLAPSTTAQRGNPLVLGLPASVIGRISDLAPQARLALAGCPFALVGVHLHDPGFWQTAGVDPSALQTYRHTPLQGSRTEQLAIQGFLFLTLSFAWHIAQTSPVTARWMLGATPSALSRLRALQFGVLHEIAERCPGLLHARLSNQRRLWEDLVSAAASDSRQARFAAVSLGLQLSAVAGAARRGANATQGVPRA